MAKNGAGKNVVLKELESIFCELDSKLRTLQRAEEAKAEKVVTKALGIDAAMEIIRKAVTASGTDSYSGGGSISFSIGSQSIAGKMIAEKSKKYESLQEDLHAQYTEVRRAIIFGGEDLLPIMQFQTKFMEKINALGGKH